MQIQLNTKKLFRILITFFLLSATFTAGVFFQKFINNSNSDSQLINPFVSSEVKNQKPLLKYSIPTLQEREYLPSEISITKIISEADSYTSFEFQYTTLGKRMSGQLNIPDSITGNPIQENQVIIMLRGYVPQEIYTTGTGTRNAADRLAEAGYITIAPDFFGYGNSDPEPENPWQARFEKPITVIELIKSIELNGIPLNAEASQSTQNITDIGIWAHSNGGQIALTTIEILEESISTSLWAPVTAPFPYSVLYFSDELVDEGKSQRKWISLFEDEYDAFEFSLTQHLDKLQGPIQIQHGTADDAALIFWSREFVDKIAEENERRTDFKNSTKNDLLEFAATQSAKAIEIELIEHPNTNHNMVPRWDIAIQNDLKFFAQNLE